MATKRIPLRMCAICRQQFPKRTLIRLVRSSDGRVSLDETGKMPGRGLYVCRSEDCLRQALKGTRLEKAAGAKIEDGILAQLQEKFTIEYSEPQIKIGSREVETGHGS